MYLIFGGRQYYASGVANDFLGARESKERALEFAERVIGCHALQDSDEILEYDNEIEWSHVLDIRNNEVIAKYGSPPYGDCSMVTKILTKSGNSLYLGPNFYIELIKQ